LQMALGFCLIPGDPAEALDQIERFESRFHADPITTANRAVTLYRLGRSSEAFAAALSLARASGGGWLWTPESLDSGEQLQLHYYENLRDWVLEFEKLSVNEGLIAPFGL